jgi:hypothetical protein
MPIETYMLQESEISALILIANPRLKLRPVFGDYVTNVFKRRYFDLEL